jgi:hypothetical protein
MLLNVDCENKEYFVFFGVILGYAIRSNSPMMLDLHPIVWKQINKTELTEADLISSDLFGFNDLNKIRKV